MQFFNDMKMKAKLMFGFGFVLAIFVVIGAVAYYTTIESQRTAKWVEHTYRVMDLAEEALAGLVDMETGYRGFLVTGKEVFLEPYHKGNKVYQDRLTALQELTSDNLGQVARWQDIAQRAQIWQKEVIQPGLKLRRDILAGQAQQQELIDFESSGLGKQHFDEMRRVFAEAIAEEEQLLTVRVAENRQANDTLLTLLVGGGVIGVCLCIIIVVLTSRAIADPLNKMVSMIQEIAKGNLDQRAQMRRRDEVGQLAAAFNELVIYIQSVSDATNALSSGDLTVKVEARSNRDVLAQSFTTMIQNLNVIIRNVSENAGALNQTSQELSGIARQMNDEAITLSDKSQMVAGAAEQMSANMSSVSVGAEEMTATIREIAQNAEKGRNVTTDAVQSVKQATMSVESLQNAAGEISKVIEVIMEIAEQTKLLALNATIEAARAGEAGKGFAVVASEVKDLAQQTNDATEDIKNKIETMQGSTNHTVTEIREINNVITQVSDIVASIASAVEEQSATTQNIAKTVNEAAVASNGISEDISEVSESSKKVKTATDVINARSGNLSSMGGELQEVVAQFTLGKEKK